MNDTLDRTLDALGSPHRRAIVDRLVAGPIPTPALGTEFAMSKQALHKHLSILEAAGLVERRTTGRTKVIHLRTEPLDDVATWATTVRAAWASSLERLADVLGEADEPDPSETSTTHRRSI